MGHECCIRTGKKKKKKNNNNNNRRRNLCREETITAAASNRIVTIMPRGEARSPWSKQRRGRRRRRRRGGGTMMDRLEHPWSTTSSTLLSGNAAFCEESAASLWLSLALFCTTSTATV
jgi:hypothetical protein